MSLDLFLIVSSFPVRNVNKISKAPEAISKIMKRLHTETSREELWKGYVVPFTCEVSVPALTSDLYSGFIGNDLDLV